MPLPNVTGKILSKIIEYCAYHTQNSKDADKTAAGAAVKSAEDIKSWDDEFMKVDQSTLFELILVRPGLVTHLLQCFSASYSFTAMHSMIMLLRLDQCRRQITSTLRPCLTLPAKRLQT